MPTPSTTIIHPTKSILDDAPEQRQGWLDALLQRDRLWLLLILLMFTAFLLGGCTSRGPQPLPMEVTGTCPADGVVAAFYLFYLLGWVIVAASGG